MMSSVLRCNLIRGNGVINISSPKIHAVSGEKQEMHLTIVSGSSSTEQP